VLLGELDAVEPLLRGMMVIKGRRRRRKTKQLFGCFVGVVGQFCGGRRKLS
jgi:hypothetical protein